MKGRGERSKYEGGEVARGSNYHTDPNKMSLSASFPGAASTSSFVLVVDVGVDILANCSAAFLSLDKVVRLLLTASVIRTEVYVRFSFNFSFF